MTDQQPIDQDAVELLESRCRAIDQHYARFPDSLDRTMEDTAKAIRHLLAAWNRRASPPVRDGLVRLREWLLQLPIPTPGVVPQIRNVDAILALTGRGKGDE